MIHKFELFIGLLAFIWAPLACSASCSGKGTVVAYGNGMFNSWKDAEESRLELMSTVQGAGLHADGKRLIGRLAYKTSEPFFEQLMGVALQKQVTDFESFWAWVYSLEESPAWFKTAYQDVATQFERAGTLAFLDLENQFEDYARYIRNGYNVILVSHSQGNFYANQSMRKLGGYTDLSLTGSIDEKGQLNPLFPAFGDLFANVQVATPVRETVRGAPWVTLKEDAVISAVRLVSGALPANASAGGVSFSPRGDFFGHDFVKAYLRSTESQKMIRGSVQAAFDRLRYPITIFQPAFMIEYPRHLDQRENFDLAFSVHDPYGEEVFGYDEQRPGGDLQINQNFTDCNELKVGDSIITADTVVDDGSAYDFQYTGWPEGKVDPQHEKPVAVSLHAKNGIQRWDVGVIHTRAGIGKEPLEVKVEIYPQPRERIIR